MAFYAVSFAAEGNDANGSLYVWNVHTAAVVRGPFRDCPATPHGGGGIINGRSAICTLRGKPGIKTWSLNADSAPALYPSAERLGPIAANGYTVVAGTPSGRAIAWISGEMRRWDAHYGSIDVVAALSWGVVTGGADGAVKLWTLPSLYSTSPTPYISFSAHTLPVTALVASSTRLFSASTDRSVKVYDIPSRSVSVSHSFPSALSCLAVSSTETLLFAGSHDGTIWMQRVMHATSEPQALNGHKLRVQALAITLDGAHLISGSDDGSCRVWALRPSPVPLHSFTRHNAPITALHVFLASDLEVTDNGVAPPMLAFPKFQEEQIPQTTALELRERREKRPRGATAAEFESRCAARIETLTSNLKSASSTENLESRIEELESDVAAAKKEAERWSVLTQRLYRESLLRLADQRGASGESDNSEGGGADEEDEAAEEGEQEAK